MFNYIRFEIKSVFSKRNIFVLVLCLLFSLCNYGIDKINFDNSITTEIENLTTSEKEEQQRIDILKYNLKHNQKKQTKQELVFWNELIVYTQMLKEAYKKGNEREILKIRLIRNTLILEGLNKRYLSRYTVSFIPSKKSLRQKIKLDTLNLENNKLDGVYEHKPTFIHTLKGVCSVNTLTYIFIALIAVINSNLWSKEFSNDRCYQVIFSYPLKRRTILMIRNMVNIAFSLFVVLVVALLISIMGLFQYGSGMNQYIFSEGIIQNIFNVISKDLCVFSLSLLLFVQLIQIFSLVIKDEMIVNLLFLVVLLVSVYFVKGWNPFSFLKSYNINYPIWKCVILIGLNWMMIFFSNVCIEKMDFE